MNLTSSCTWYNAIIEAAHCLMQGWNMALKDPSLHFPADQKDIDALIKQRISGKLKVAS